MITANEAAAQAEMALPAGDYLLGFLLARLVRKVVGNPATNSDQMLFLADALRELATVPRILDAEAEELRRVASRLADLAPSRA